MPIPTNITSRTTQAPNQPDHNVTVDYGRDRMAIGPVDQVQDHRQEHGTLRTAPSDAIQGDLAFSHMLPIVERTAIMSLLGAWNRIETGSKLTHYRPLR